MAYIELKNLNKAFGEKVVVNDLNLSLERGKILCLLGPSGCGKTTTLRMIGGFLEADSGSICLDGEEISALPPEGRPVATVFQSYALFPNMTVIENVMYGLKFKGINRAKAREIALSKLEVTGLADYAGARVNEISGGQQQRVALARALAVEPKVLLLDEPLSNLDAKLRIRMRDELKELQKQLDMTMIFVTHDQEEAMVLADSIAIMHDGYLIQTGPPREVYDHPATQFAMEFLGSANRLTLSSGEVIYLRPEKLRILGAYSDGAMRTAETEKKAGTHLICADVVRGEYLGFYTLYFARTDQGEEIVLRSVDGNSVPEGTKLILAFEDADVLMRGAQ
ncbi:MAG: ABC transporter ATP-binding protein [Eubacteriales bacterium]|nr:ABC transporter ATP-binding protein [Eubacteriales bacterium]